MKKIFCKQQNPTVVVILLMFKAAVFVTMLKWS